MIVITGASEGLGEQVAKLYQEAGKTVVNISRKECRHADHNICLSLREGPEIQEAADRVMNINEPLEVLINCAGVFSCESWNNISEEEIKRIMSTNVKPILLLVSYMYDRIEQDETDIVNVSSSAGRKGKSSEPVYSASKWAVRGITMGLRGEFKNKPNRVIDVCPGGMNTEFFVKASCDDISTETFMSPEDVAVAIKNTLDLPKNVEVSEIVINRK